MIDKDEVSGWLKEQKLDPQDGKAENADWLLTCIFRDLPIILVQPKGESRMVLQRVLGLGKGSIVAQSKKPKELREDFLYHLKRDLLLSHARYTMEFEDPEEKTILKGLILESHIYDGGLSRDMLFQRIYLLHDATILFFILMKKFDLGAQ